MRIYLLSFRDEFFPEPHILIGFRDMDHANLICDQMRANYDKLKTRYFDGPEVEGIWSNYLDSVGIPEDARFKVNPKRTSNYSFEIRWVDVRD